MTTRVAAFGRFWYRFVVGDDWTLAAISAVALLGVFLLHRGGREAWWLLPPMVLLALGQSLWRAHVRP